MNDNNIIQDSPVTEEKIREAVSVLAQKYKPAKQSLENKIIENEKWFKSQHWDLIRTKSDEAEPTTAWLLNTLANKHADAMDNFPEPIIIERVKDDIEEANVLSKVIPLVFEKCRFYKTYDRAYWQKLKHGTAVYGIFWNPELEDGKGDIDIKNISLLNIYWQPGITNIQDSKYLFVTSLIDRDILEQRYPDKKDVFRGSSKYLEPKKFNHDDQINTDDKVLVIDWYRKVKIGNRTVVHLTKICNDTKLESTEDNPYVAQTGLYSHGMFPFEFDILFPEEDFPTGFGYIDVIKNPQMYIDKLDQIISKNALLAGKKRWFVRQGTGVNMNQFLDWNQDIVEVAGSLEETHIREFSINPLNAYIIQHRNMKINEMKEVSGVNDFNRGTAGGGVTAAAAIAALQEAGNKLSRDMLKSTFESHQMITYMSIELIRQFYDEPRMFRILDDEGKANYIQYTNKRLQERLVIDENGKQYYQKPVFDIKIKAQRTNPFASMAQNEIAKELYSMGFFNPNNATASLMALELMNFEGKDRLVKMIKENDLREQGIRNAIVYLQKIIPIIQKTTGEDLSQEIMQIISQLQGGQLQ